MLKYLLKKWGFYLTILLFYVFEAIVIFLVPVLMHIKHSGVYEESFLISICLLTTLIPAVYLFIMLFKSEAIKTIDLSLISRCMTKRQLAFGKLSLLTIISFFVALISAIIAWFSLLYPSSLNGLVGLGWFTGTFLSILFYISVAVFFSYFLTGTLSVFLTLCVGVSMFVYDAVISSSATSNLKALKQNGYTFQMPVELQNVDANGNVTNTAGGFLRYDGEPINESYIASHPHLYYLSTQDNDLALYIWNRYTNGANYNTLEKFAFLNQFSTVLTGIVNPEYYEKTANNLLSLEANPYNSGFRVHFNLEQPQNKNPRLQINTENNRYEFLRTYVAGFYFNNAFKYIKKEISPQYNLNNLNLLSLPQFVLNTTNPLLSTVQFKSQLNTINLNNINKLKPWLNKVTSKKSAAFLELIAHKLKLVNIGQIFYANLIYFNCLHYLHVNNLKDLFSSWSKLFNFFWFFNEQWISFNYLCVYLYNNFFQDLDQNEKAILFSTFSQLNPNVNLFINPVVPLYLAKVKQHIFFSIVNNFKNKKDMFFYSPNIFIVNEQSLVGFIPLKTTLFYNLGTLIGVWYTLIFLFMLVSYLVLINKDFID